jgi:hypothetical protein
MSDDDCDADLTDVDSSFAEIDRLVEVALLEKYDLGNQVCEQV